MTYRDRLPGGLADERRPSDFDQKELRRGIKVEREHTDDPEIAREIAMDHLAEDAAYYEKLDALERSSFRMQDNPGHPPKAWFNRCVQGVRKSGGAYDPQAVCGAQWQKKSESEKRRLSRGREELENPIGGLGIALYLGAAALAGYLFFSRRKPAAPTAMIPAPTPSTTPTPATCTINITKLESWGAARGFPVIYFSDAVEPPTFEQIVAAQPQIANTPSGNQVVAVIADGSFWYFIKDSPSMGRADNLRADYCAFTGTQTTSGIYGPYAALS